MSAKKAYYFQENTMIHHSKLGRKEQVFTFIDPDDHSRQLSFAVTSLIRDPEYLKIEPVFIPIEKEFYDMLMTNRGVEEHRVSRITFNDFKNYPVTCVDMGDGTHLMIDGTHRCVRYFREGLKTTLARLVPKSLWEKYLVDGFPLVPPDRIDDFQNGFSGIV
jgi:hypothetical protein